MKTGSDMIDKLVTTSDELLRRAFALRGEATQLKGRADDIRAKAALQAHIVEIEAIEQEIIAEAYEAAARKLETKP